MRDLAGQDSDESSTRVRAEHCDVVFLLHAHLPYCRRPDLSASLEETWYFEAVTECYLPLIAALDRLWADDIRARFTLSLSPVLLQLFADEELGQRYVSWLARTVDLACRDAAAHGHLSQKSNAAWHADFLANARTQFDERCQRDITSVFRKFHLDGALELATTAATHAFLPAYQGSPDIVRCQINLGIDAFESAVGLRPRCFWLPECGYFPGIEDILAQAGIEVFAVESHAITQATPPAAGTHIPITCSGSVRAVGRNHELSAAVWSARSGYPGDHDYREFHHDRIHELPEEMAQAWKTPTGGRLPSGLKYWRVTGPGNDKDWYSPVAGEARATQHARDFVARIASQSPAGICLLPFDAELFGHWWFEGVMWLEQVMRGVDTRGDLQTRTLSDAIDESPHTHEATPAASTWGHRGDNSYWITHETAWLYPQLVNAHERLARLARTQESDAEDSARSRALSVAARVLLLAQASDWPFMISAQSAPDLARGHIERLLNDLEPLLRNLEQKGDAPDNIGELESRYPLFESVNPSQFVGC